MCMCDYFFTFNLIEWPFRFINVTNAKLFSLMLLFVYSPVMLRKFDSGVMVIQNKAHSDEEVIFLFVPFHFSSQVGATHTRIEVSF